MMPSRSLLCSRVVHFVRNN